MGNSPDRAAGKRIHTGREPRETRGDAGKKAVYEDRVRRGAAWLASNGISCAILEDTEGRRNSSVRYYTGMNQDAILFLFADGGTTLVAWDEIMASRIAFADTLLPYTEFGRDFPLAVREILKRAGIAGTDTNVAGPGRGGTGSGRSSSGLGRSGSAGVLRIEIGSAAPHTQYEELSAALSGIDILCRRNGFEAETVRMRQVKDPLEMSCLEKACSIADAIAGGLLAGIRSDEFRTELDAAMFIESEARRMGAEGTGFETLAAGPGRSFGIHAFPTFSNASIREPGMSIFDFGVRFEGYSSDITMTVVRGIPSRLQEEMIELVEEAYGLAVSMLAPGVDGRSVSQAVDRLFAKRGFAMPHSLGHGIGLDVHEAPFFRSVAADPVILDEGMVFTVEPGLYHPEAGGVRWENDFVIRNGKAEPLTSSRIHRIP